MKHPYICHHSSSIGWCSVLSRVRKNHVVNHFCFGHTTAAVTVSKDFTSQGNSVSLYVNLFTRRYWMHCGFVCVKENESRLSTNGTGKDPPLTVCGDDWSNWSYHSKTVGHVSVQFWYAYLSLSCLWLSLSLPLFLSLSPFLYHEGSWQRRQRLKWVFVLCPQVCVLLSLKGAWHWLTNMVLILIMISLTEVALQK